MLPCGRSFGENQLFHCSCSNGTLSPNYIRKLMFGMGLSKWSVIGILHWIVLITAKILETLPSVWMYRL